MRKKEPKAVDLNSADYAEIELRILAQMKPYVTTPSENFAERENQVSDYHPDLCFKLGQTHKGYNWSPVPRGDWDDAQKATYLRAFK